MMEINVICWKRCFIGNKFFTVGAHKNDAYLAA